MTWYLVAQLRFKFNILSFICSSKVQSPRLHRWRQRRGNRCQRIHYHIWGIRRLGRETAWQVRDIQQQVWKRKCECPAYCCVFARVSFYHKEHRFNNQLYSSHLLFVGAKVTLASSRSLSFHSPLALSERNDCEFSLAFRKDSLSELSCFSSFVRFFEISPIFRLIGRYFSDI